MEEREDRPARRAITSEGLTPRAIKTCYVGAVLLMGAGITATFVAGTGAAPAAMILFGSLFLVLALMKRVPLSLEVGGAKIDASYEVDVAYDAGRELGVQQGVEDALSVAEKASGDSDSAEALVRRLRHNLSALRNAPPTEWMMEDLPDRHHQEPHKGSAEGSHTWAGRATGHAPTAAYRGPVACNAAGISYRQLDYWARTGLAEPSASHRNHRLYTVNDIVILRLIKQLLDAGVSLKQIRTVVHHVRERAPNNLERITLISDGDSVYEATSDAEVLDLLGSGDGVFGISLGGVFKYVRGVLRELPPESLRAAEEPPGGSADTK